MSHSNDPATNYLHSTPAYSQALLDPPVSTSRTSNLESPDDDDTSAKSYEPGISPRAPPSAGSWPMSQPQFQDLSLANHPHSRNPSLAQHSPLKRGATDSDDYEGAERSPFRQGLQNNTFIDLSGANTKHVGIPLQQNSPSKARKTVVSQAVRPSSPSSTAISKEMPSPRASVAPSDKPVSLAKDDPTHDARTSSQATLAQPTRSGQRGSKAAPVVDGPGRWSRLDRSEAVIHEPVSMLKQPPSLTISQEQLGAEVKGIYAGLAMVEAKSINVVNVHMQNIREATQNGTQAEVSAKIREHLPGLVALQRTLLHEHHDFLLATQHPSASTALRELASKYSMPGRLWKHGIHSFLELLRHHLPMSIEFMLAFIYLAFQMIALLYETVQSFTDTWIECLGDLSRYRMAIEDDDQRDRDIWAGVSRYWYGIARDRNPKTGRLLHHLAILARAHPLQQLSLYTRSLTAVFPFPSTNDSILTLMDPMLARSEEGNALTLAMDIWFVKSHSILFTRGSPERFSSVLRKYLLLLPGHIRRANDRWREPGSFLAICNVAALFSYGDSKSTLWRIFQPQASQESEGAELDLAVKEEVECINNKTTFFSQAWQLTFSTFEEVLRHTENDGTMPHVHIILLFLVSTLSVPRGAKYLAGTMPWLRLAQYLNWLLVRVSMDTRFDRDEFLLPPKGDRQCLPEDLLVRGQYYAQSYFTSTWFTEEYTNDQDERTMEKISTSMLRAERIVWLGRRLSRHCPTDANGEKYLEFDEETHEFSSSEPPRQVKSMDDEHLSAVHTLPSSLLNAPLSKKDIDNVEIAGTREVK